MNEVLSALAQYGPLGIIAGALLYINLTHQKQMAERLTTLENSLMQIIKNNTEVMSNATSATNVLIKELQDRPCWFYQPEIQKLLKDAGFLRSNGSIQPRS